MMQENKKMKREKGQIVQENWQMMRENGETKIEKRQMIREKAQRMIKNWSEKEMFIKRKCNFIKLSCK